MLKKSILGILLISMLTGFFGLSCNGAITGLVTDKDNNPVEGATVTTNKVSTTTVYAVTTGADGKYTLGNIPSDNTYTITATKGIFTGSLADVTLDNPSFFGCHSPTLSDKNIQFGTAQKTLIDENFESYSEISNGTGGWQIGSREPSTPPVIASTGAITTSKSLLLECEDHGAVDVMRNFDATSISLLDMEGYIRVSSTSTELHIGFVRYGYGGINIMNEAGTITVCYGENMNDSKTTGVTIVNDEWYKIKLTIDIANSTWTVWIDDHDSGTAGVYSDNICPSIFALELVTESGEPSRKAYFDEIKVTATVSDANKVFCLRIPEIPKTLSPGLFHGFRR